jgi:hypothetical protein
MPTSQYSTVLGRFGVANILPSIHSISELHPGIDLETSEEIFEKVDNTLTRCVYKLAVDPYSSIESTLSSWLTHENLLLLPPLLYTSSMPQPHQIIRVGSDTGMLRVTVHDDSTNLS